MPASRDADPTRILEEIQAERDQLAASLAALRGELGTGLAGRLESRLPLTLALAFGAGFVLAGGLGASMRLLARRSRERHVAGRLGPLVLLERR